MGKHQKTDPAEYRSAISRLYGSMPWLKARERERFKAKIFKSGNSLALRLPAGLNLAAGMEMELTVEDGMFFSFEPLVTPKRKFNIAKVAGSATDLAHLSAEDRMFEDRASPWGDAGLPEIMGDPS